MFSNNYQFVALCNNLDHGAFSNKLLPGTRYVSVIATIFLKVPVHPRNRHRQRFSYCIAFSPWVYLYGDSGGL